MHDAQTAPERKSAAQDEEIHALVLVDWITAWWRFQIRVACGRNPLWWHIDAAGWRRIALVGVHLSNAPHGKTPLVSAILGPLQVRLGWVRR